MINYYVRMYKKIKYALLFPKRIIAERISKNRFKNLLKLFLKEAKLTMRDIDLIGGCLHFNYANLMGKRHKTLLQKK